jgi:alkylation response protein AidB-like acyl-CoA dehydrogenase
VDFFLSEEQRAWQLKARKFAQENIRPISLQRDRISDPRETFDWNIIRQGSKLGFRTAAAPKEWGGHGIDFVTQALVIAELAKGDSAIAKTFSQCWKWSHLIAESCTPDQKERFLKPFLEDDTYLLGGGITEPAAGSDNRLPPDDDPKAGYKLRAERKGDEWILNGEKCFIANASVGKLFFIYTRTDPNVAASEGTTIFLVPINTPGLRVGTVYNKSGWRFYQNAELIFENARVPHSNMVGEVNGGHKARGGKASKFGELEYAANAVGVCDAAVEMAMEYAAARMQNGKRVIEQQVVQLKLSAMHMLTEALRSFVMRVAAESDDNTSPHSAHNHFLMNFASDAIQRVCNFNLDIQGGTGVAMMDAGADKLVRDAIIWTHIAGDSVQRMKAIRHMIKYHRS